MIRKAQDANNPISYVVNAFKNKMEKKKLREEF